MNSYTDDWNDLYKYFCCILVLFINMRYMSNYYKSDKQNRKRNKAFRVSGDFESSN